MTNFKMPILTTSSYSKTWSAFATPRPRCPMSPQMRSAEHFEAARDLHAAFDWHMRSGSWVNYRDNLAAAKSWRRAQQVADQLPDDDPSRLTMRTAPRTLLCATGFRTSGSGFSLRFRRTT